MLEGSPAVSLEPWLPESSSTRIGLLIVLPGSSVVSCRKADVGSFLEEFACEVDTRGVTFWDLFGPSSTGPQSGACLDSTGIPLNCGHPFFSQALYLTVVPSWQYAAILSTRKSSFLFKLAFLSAKYCLKGSPANGDIACLVASK